MVTFQSSINLFIFFCSLLSLLRNMTNFIFLLILLEIIFLSLNLNFIIFSLYVDDIIGQAYVVYILTIVGIESAIGLALLILYYDNFKTIKTKQITILKY